MPNKPIRWKIRIAATPDEIFDLIATDAGRRRFWCDESTASVNEFILGFASGEQVTCEVLEALRPERFIFSYFDDSRIEVCLAPATGAMTTVEVHEANCPEDHWLDNHAGWVAWLYCLKAAAELDVKFRHSDPQATWSRGFVDG